MKVFYSDTYELPLPETHHFPADKYRVARELLQQSEFVDSLDFHLPPAATDELLLRVHTAEYVRKVCTGRLSRVEQRRIGFPWSEAMVERHRRSTGATLAAARAALAWGAGIHLAGGTHHAFADRGEGFCVFNDVAVATTTLIAEQQIERVVVIDLDVHQGNGTAAIFADDPNVFTFSMHGERNFPQVKGGSDLDIQLADGTGDDEFLQNLQDALATKLPVASADLVFYIAGADPYEGDRYGRLSLSKAGLAERDRLVCQHVKQAGCPLTVVMGGGYASDIRDIAEINVRTVAEVVSAFS